MMSLAEIRQFYPANLHSKSAFLLREYLQCKILELLFESPYAAKFAFLGGTCLQIVHGSQRFSEDLDFILKESQTHFDMKKYLFWNYFIS